MAFNPFAQSAPGSGVQGSGPGPGQQQQQHMALQQHAAAQLRKQQELQEQAMRKPPTANAGQSQQHGQQGQGQGGSGHPLMTPMPGAPGNLHPKLEAQGPPGQQQHGQGQSSQAQGHGQGQPGLTPDVPLTQQHLVSGQAPSSNAGGPQPPPTPTSLANQHVPMNISQPQSPVKMEPGKEEGGMQQVPMTVDTAGLNGLTPPRYPL